MDDDCCNSKKCLTEQCTKTLGFGTPVSGTPELEPKERVTMLPGWRELPPVSERGWARMPKGDPRGALGEPGEKGEASGLGVGRMVGG